MLKTSFLLLALGPFLLTATPLPELLAVDEERFEPPKNAFKLESVNFEGADKFADVEIGVIASGFESVFEMALQNQTDEQLKFLDVESSCGCLMATPESKMVEAGGSTKIYFTINPNRTGKQRKYFKIAILAGNSPAVLTINLLGEARELYECSINAFDVDQQKGLDTTIAITKLMPKLRDVEVRVLSPQLEMKEVEGGDELTRLFQLRSKDWKWRANEINRNVQLAFVHGEDRIYEIVLQARNPNGFVVRPQRATAKGQDADGNIRFKFFVQCGDSTPEHTSFEDIVLELSANDALLQTVSPNRIQRIGDKTLLIEIALAENSRLNGISELEASWRFGKNQAQFAKSKLLLR